ncbi:MAG: ATP-grasp domain-containing protein [Planctomycetota bacterium]|nr:ATP-grasp domain-containing protein [Planctomycetota bacterium]
MTTTDLKLVFLGAGKRLSLLERFLDAARAENVRLSLICVEAQDRPPVASVAKIVRGPKFSSPEFAPHLTELVAREGAHAVIPTMDAACTALSACARALPCAAIVSDHALCAAMEDKVASDEFFRSHGLPVPTLSPGAYPRIAKSRRGFGSRDQAVLETAEDEAAFFARRARDGYIVQPFLRGREFTVDAYVDRGGRALGALSRLRIEVSAGEVDVSETLRRPAILALTRRVLALPGWRGPITLQFIEADPESSAPALIEINPRFGGGVTHAIHCGLDMPRWILRELLGRPVEPADDWPEHSFMTRCRRDIFL